MHSRLRRQHSALVMYSTSEIPEWVVSLAHSVATSRIHGQSQIRPVFCFRTVCVFLKTYFMRRKMCRNRRCLQCIHEQVCWASSVSCQHDATRICCLAPAGLQHGARSYLSISPSHMAFNSKNTPCASASVDRWDRQIDGRTPDRYIDPALHTVRAA